MRLSVVTPVLTRVPGAHARWEEDAGMAELVEIARAADRLGYHHVTCSEHVGIPAEVAKVRGATYWDGGRTRRSLRRAVALADGWAPFGVSAAQVADWLTGVEPPEGFEVVISPERAVDPSDAASACADALGALAAAGTTIVAARLVHHSLAHYLEQLEALAGYAAIRREAV